MAYTAYELDAGAALSGVASLCRHAARFNGAFDTATIPSLTQVEAWLTESYYWIQGQLSKYSFDIDQSAAPDAVLSILQQLNVYDTCCKVELSLPGDSVTGEPNQRFQTFENRRDELWRNLNDGTIGALGATTVAAPTVRQPLITGISRSRKKVLETNTDATQHRIRRDGFLNPGIAPVTSEEDYVQ
jgi:hypothetical protein